MSMHTVNTNTLSSGAGVFYDGEEALDLGQAGGSEVHYGYVVQGEGWAGLGPRGFTLTQTHQVLDAVLEQVAVVRRSGGPGQSGQSVRLYPGEVGWRCGAERHASSLERLN